MVDQTYLLAYDPIQKVPRVVQILEILPQHKALESVIICKYLTLSSPQYTTCKAKELKPLTPETIAAFKAELDVIVSTANKITEEYKELCKSL